MKPNESIAEFLKRHREAITHDGGFTGIGAGPEKTLTFIVEWAATGGLRRSFTETASLIQIEFCEHDLPEAIMSRLVRKANETKE